MVSATISFCIDEEAVAQRGQVKCARLNSLVKEKPILDPGNQNCNLVLLLLHHADDALYGKKALWR